MTKAHKAFNATEAKNRFGVILKLADHERALALHILEKPAVAQAQAALGRVGPDRL